MPTETLSPLEEAGGGGGATATRKTTALLDPEIVRPAVLEPDTDMPDGKWRVLAATGRPVPTSPEDGQLSAPLAAGSVLVLAGRAWKLMTGQCSVPSSPS